MIACACLAFAATSRAQTQTDIPGPSDSINVLSNGNFIINKLYLYTHDGTKIKTLARPFAAELPNGNLVGGSSSDYGWVDLYDPTGATISTLSGASINDNVGRGGVTVLASGNFVVSSPNWVNGSAAQAGAVTWVDGNIGLNGTVSASNSLVGTQPGDGVGYSGIKALANGNYIVVSAFWANGAIASAGAVTWGDGTIGTSGVVSAANSLVGSTDNDMVGSGSVTALPGGNCVVVSPNWTNGSAAGAGAVTWIDGATGRFGAISASNSLVGSASNDAIGDHVIVLSNGNYVVASTHWSGGTGAVTWSAANAGVIGAITSANSFVGNTTSDGVGRITKPLSNGNYAVLAHSATKDAITWANGSTGRIGNLSEANALVVTLS